MDEYLKLKQLVDEVADDIYKAVGGNKAAGTRVRKIMQDIKNTAQEVRKKVLDLRGADEPPAPPQ
ncbi:MAG: histone H1 [Phycisphaerae bacterium]|jgi:signal transduction histidine kinase|nr:histone H1 [Phycisphaerae bacterium]